MKNVRETILNSSKELFVKKGYSKTTIREIISKSGILSGSIYHFFDNKEDIFKSLILELFDDYEQMIFEKFGKVKSSEVLYVLRVVSELRAIEKSERIRELYYEAYTSKSIFEKIVKQAANKSRQIFYKYNEDYGISDYYNVNLMIKGAMRSCIIDCDFDNRELAKRDEMYVRMILSLMNVPKEKVQDIIDEIDLMDIEIEYIVNKFINEKYMI